MSGLSRTAGGLYVPSGSYEAAVLAALQAHDPDLRLIPQGTDRRGKTFWKVARYMGDRPVQFILTWGDISKGEAYDLSFGIVDEVQRLDRSTRGAPEGSDAINRRLLEQREKDSRDLGEAIADEFRDYLGDGTGNAKRSHVPVPGRALQLSRIRQRRKLPPELRP